MVTDTFKWIGAPVKRPEDPAFLQGAATYVTDVAPAHVKHVAFVRSPHPHARIKQIDTSRALGAKGVVAVLTGKQAAQRSKPIFGTRFFPSGMGQFKLPKDFYCLPIDKVRYVGEAVVAVAADTRYEAEDAAELVEIEYDVLPPVVDAAAAAQPGAPLVHEHWGDNVAWQHQFRSGDSATALEEADGIARERFVAQRRSGVPLEPRGITARYDRATGELTVWAGNQRAHFLRDQIAEILELQPVSVRVITPHMGGGFGVKANAYPEDLATVVLAVETGLPTKWVEDRSEHFLSAAHDHEQVHEMEIGYKNDGTILGIRDRITNDAGSTLNALYSGGSMQLNVGTLLLPNTYKLRYFEYDTASLATNKAPHGAVRGFGQIAGRFAIERMMDMIAKRLGMDPAEIRFKNMITEFPYRSLTGLPYDVGSYTECLQKALDAVGYRAFRAEEQARLRSQGIYQGIGLVSLVEQSGPTSRGRKTVVGHASATLRIDATGRIAIYTGEATHGQSHHTTFAQVAAEVFDVPPERISVTNGDTLLAPYTGGTFGNRSAPLTASAIWLAAKEVREKAFRIAAKLLEANQEDLEAVDGQVGVKGDPSKRIPLSTIGLVAHTQPSELPTGMQLGLESTQYYQYDAPMTAGNAAEAVKVQVNIRTGEVEILKFVVVHDCGRMINPNVVHGQIHGQIASEIGYAFHERIVYDENGQLLTGTLMDYHLPQAPMVPREVEIHSIETPGTLNPLGTKGMGEGSVGVASIANAIEDALEPFGVHINFTPITPERLLEQIQRREENSG